MTSPSGRMSALPSSASSTALIVDRDADTLAMYEQYLTLRSWRVMKASDGREALAKAIAERPDVIVTETRLPGMSGFDLCTLLRRDTLTRDIPILIVTGDGYEPHLQHARDAGADAVLVKPCLPDDLRAAIDRLVAASRDLRDRSSRARTAGTAQLQRAVRAVERSQETARRLNLKQAHIRQDTTKPPVPPPSLICPSCDRSLVYQRSHVGGVSVRHQEQWDYFECPGGCGTFQYRTRTRRLRRV